LINAADLIFCMMDFHADQVKSIAPHAAGKVLRLRRDGDISDPMGAGADVYRDIARIIEKAVRARLEEAQ